MFPLSTLFLWLRFQVGTPSTLYLSQLCTALPETKWRLHTRSFARIFSVKSDQLIAEIQRVSLSKDNFSASLPWFLTTDRTRANEDHYLERFRLYNQDHAENHLHSEDVTRFVYSITPPICRRSDGYLAFGHVRQQLEESLQQVTPDEDTAYKVTPSAAKSKTPRRSS